MNRIGINSETEKKYFPFALPDLLKTKKIAEPSVSSTFTTGLAAQHRPTVYMVREKHVPVNFSSWPSPTPGRGLFQRRES